MNRCLAIVAALLIASCGLIAPKNSTQAVYDLRAGYDAAFLAPAATYNELRRCAPAVAQPCSDAKVVDQLRKADAAAKALLDGAEDVARNHPQLDAGLALAAASDAVAAAQKVLTIYGTGGAKP